jgi:hypothetical protein
VTENPSADGPAGLDEVLRSIGEHSDELALLRQTLTTLGEAAAAQAGTIGSLQDQMAALLAEDAPERGYKPVPAPRWHELSLDEYEEEVARLRSWVDEVFRPCYGHIVAGLHDCWPKHPLVLVLLDYLSETWKVLHLRRSRSSQILGTQLEFQLRYLPAAAEMLTEDMRQCARVHQAPGTRTPRAV